MRKFKDLMPGDTFGKGESIFIKIQEVITKQKMEFNGLPVYFNSVCIGGRHNMSGTLIHLEDNDEVF